MSERSVEHATFVVERTYDASPARVFAAWADPVAKASWFGGGESEGGEFELDFRVGGRELNSGAAPDGNVYTFEGRYQDIVPDQRIVYSYDMLLGETRISVSLATVEAEARGRRHPPRLHRAGRLPRRPRHTGSARAGDGRSAGRAGRAVAPRDRGRLIALNGLVRFLRQSGP
jgi:uncharacterized protein YndB with AHSA1/START domain